MTETLADQPSGVCHRSGCPVATGGSPCLLGKPLIDCDFFDPDPDPDPDLPPGTRQETAAVPSDLNDQAAIDGPIAAADNGLANGPDTGEHADASDEAADLSPYENVAVPNDLSSGPTEQVSFGQLSTKTASGDGASGDAQVSEEPTHRRVRKPEGPKNTVRFDDGPPIPIRSGLALTADEAREVMASEPVTLVVFAGPPDAGKTTLFASIYETLLTEPLGNWSFAGSRTMLAFAMRSWWASTASGRTRPITPRTRYDVSRPWLHLRLAHNHDAHQIRSLLVADISGEYFSTVGGGGDLNDAASLVARADHVVHVLDAELLVGRAERLRALAATESLITRLVTAPHIGEHATHTMVMTKADICPADFKIKALEAAAGWAQRWLGGADVVEVAARPDNHESHPWGLDLLIESILAPRTRIQDTTAPQASIRATVEQLSTLNVELSSPTQADQVEA